MSAIDNAFIRAYSLDSVAASGTAHAGVPSHRAPAMASESAPLGQPSKPSAVLDNALTNSPATMPVAEFVRSVVPAPHIRLAPFIHTTTTLEPPAAIQDSANLEVQESDPTVISAEANAEPPPAEEATTNFDLPEITTPAAGSAANASSSGQDLSRPSLDFESRTDSPTTLARTSPPPLPLPAIVAAKSDLEEETSRAAFDVDHFAWPEVCNALLEKRASDFARLAGQLVTESALGRKVVAITGSRRGDGRTTLALTLARRLATSAVKIVLVDADFEAPQLAARLGLTVQSGWEKVLNDGLPVWEGLIESLKDRLSLLPLAPRPLSGAGQPLAADFVARNVAIIRQHLETLRKYFDVVLVDAGAIKSARSDAKLRGPLALAGSLDAAILVSDARMAAPGRVADLQRRLSEARITPLGIAENFCPSKPH
jgi:Mrp family chromosome partitioning ATPase